MEQIVGIDYGAKMSGNTVIAFIKENQVFLEQVDKKIDADNWLIIKLQEHHFTSVYLDAPLSLPAAYFGSGTNFHYRDCDVITKAMSPMFLGGLTARAMSLKHQLDISFYEVYPAHFQRTTIISEFYKQDIDLFLEDYLKKITINLNSIPENWHQVDALLALTSGIRHQQNKHLSIGNPNEGIIII
jgi:predicted nuclease with RNAse H fold